MQSLATENLQMLPEQAVKDMIEDISGDWRTDNTGGIL